MALLSLATATLASGGHRLGLPQDWRKGAVSARIVNGDSKLIQISFKQRFKTDTPPDTLIALKAPPSTVGLSFLALNHPRLTLMLQAVTLSGNRHDPRMMQQPIQQGSGQRRVLRESGIPLAER